MSAATDELSILREHLGRYRGVTLQTLEMVPEDKLAWRPVEKLFTFAEQFLHIAQTEGFYAHGLFAGDWNVARFEAPKAALTRDLLHNQLKETRAFTVEKLSALDAAQFHSIVSVPNIPVEWPLRSWLWYLVKHEIHHKTQLALYLRQIGILAPFFAFVLPAGVRPDIK